MYLIIGTAFLFIGCTEGSILVDDVNQNDMEKISNKVTRTAFIGTSTPVAPIEPGIEYELPNGKVFTKGQIFEWNDVADDWRVTGKSIWYISSMTQKDGIEKLMGKAELFVEDDRGKWEMSWHGYLTYVEGGFDIYVDAIGTGKSGDVKGLVAKWIYTMNFRFADASSFLYLSEGYIQSNN